jgi:hypothetical protein
MPGTLSYEHTEPLPPPGLHLHDLGDAVRLIRMPARWVWVLAAVAGPALGLGVSLLLLGMVGSLAWRLHADGATDLSLRLVYALLPVLFWVAWCLILILNFCRHGIVPTVIEATSRGVGLDSPGVLWGVSRRHWPVDKIERVDLRKMQDVFTRRRVYELQIGIKGRWTTLTMRLKHQDPQLPDRAAAAFRRVLGMEAERGDGL